MATAWFLTIISPGPGTGIGASSTRRGVFLASSQAALLVGMVIVRVFASLYADRDLGLYKRLEDQFFEGASIIYTAKFLRLLIRWMVSMNCVSMALGCLVRIGAWLISKPLPHIDIWIINKCVIR